MSSTRCETRISLWRGSTPCLRSFSSSSNCVKNKIRLLRLLQVLPVLPALSSTPCVMSTSMPVKEESLALPAKGKGKTDGKNGKSKWRPPCDDYWKPGGCSQGHNCPKHHPRKQPGRCAICGSTRHATSQCSRPVKPKAKNVEWEERTWSYDDEDWYDNQWEWEEYEASKGKKGKGKGSKP